MVAGGVHGDGGVDGLEQTVRIDAGDEEASFIKGLRPFGGCADADGREGVAHRGEEAAFFWQCAGV